jgi:biotin-(acetyl-CoA carboxylase) ligase
MSDLLLRMNEEKRERIAILEERAIRAEALLETLSSECRRVLRSMREHGGMELMARGLESLLSSIDERRLAKAGARMELPFDGGNGSAS